MPEQQISRTNRGGGGGGETDQIRRPCFPFEYRKAVIIRYIDL